MVDKPEIWIRWEQEPVYAEVWRITFEPALTVGEAAELTGEVEG